jgi:type IV secretion system protein VirB10
MTENNVQVVDEIEGDRRIPSVNERESGNIFRKIQVLFLLVGGVLFIFLVIYFGLVRKSQDNDEKPAKDLQISSSVPARAFDLPPPPLVEEAPVSNAPIPVDPGLPEEVADQTVDKSASPLMLKVNTERVGRVGETAPVRRFGDGQGALAGMLTGTRTSPETASMLPDRNFLLTKGNSIECVLMRRLDSTVSGTTACMANRNVYSSNGRILLIERGSRLVGEYRGGIKQGEARIFVLWTRIETPNGVIVSLDSPGMDALGGGGIPGFVDTHFWKRFGGALLLSVIDMTFEIAKERADRAVGEYNIGSSGGGDDASEMAAEALRNSINIPPTLYVNQGERISVDVARDLDFSSVYDLVVTK